MKSFENRNEIMKEKQETFSACGHAYGEKNWSLFRRIKPTATDADFCFIF
jgi:hypothetical protein